MMNSDKIKVMLFEDNNQLRQSLSALIDTIDDFKLLGAYSNALDVIDIVSRNKPDVILMDIRMPGITGIEAVKLVKNQFPEIKIIMQTVFDDDDNVFHSICAGAVGYKLKKSPPMEIMEAIKEAYYGGAPMTAGIATRVLQMFRQQIAPVVNEKIKLSERESEILTLLSQGLSYKLIADKTSISIDTVRFHIKSIYEKLHVHSASAAVSKALREKLI